MLNKNLNLAVLMFLTTTSLFVACKKDDTTTPPVVSEAEFKNRSVTPAFIKMGSEFSNVGVYTLVSSEDLIPNSGTMVYGGAPDGQGFIKNPDGNLVPSEQPKDEAIKGEEVNLAQLKEQVDALAKENDLILAKVRKRDYETASIKGLEGYVTPIIADAPAPSAQTQAKEDDLILAKAREDEITKLNAFLSPKKGLEGDVIPFIPDAPAPSAQKQLLFGYDQNFLTSSAIAMSAGTFVFYFPFANRVYNQALTNFVERQVLAQLALVTAAAATATEPQS